MCVFHVDNVPTKAIHMFCKLSGVQIFTLLIFSQWKFEPLLVIGLDSTSFDRLHLSHDFFQKTFGLVQKTV